MTGPQSTSWRPYCWGATSPEHSEGECEHFEEGNPVTYVNLDDTSRHFVTLAPSGERYLVEIASLWDSEEPTARCIGSTIIRSAGPLHHSEPKDAILYDLDDDGDALNQADAEGRLTWL